MPLLKQHVGNVMIVRVNDQPLDSPYGSIRGMDLFAATDGHLTQRDPVKDDGLRYVSHAETPTSAQAIVGPCEYLTGVVTRVAATARQELRLFGPVELLELRQGTTKADPARGGVDQRERDKSAERYAVLRFNHEMSHCPSNGVNDDTNHIATDTIRATHFGPDSEYCRFHHSSLLSLSLNRMVLTS
jgi:hypothetical protein